MNNKTIILGTLGILALGAVALATGAFAYQGTSTGFGPNYTPERHAKMQKAFESKDYSAWRAEMGDRGVTRKVTEKNFARFSEMHKLMLEGKITEANAIRVELGLGQGRGRGQGMGANRGQNRGGNFVDANGDGKCDHLQ